MIKNLKSLKTEFIAGFSMFFAIWTMAFLYAQVMQDFSYSPKHWFMTICILTISGCIWSSIFTKQPFIIAPGLGMGWFFAQLLSPQTNPKTLFLAVFISGPLLFILGHIKIIQNTKEFFNKNLQETINIGIGCLFIRIALEQQFHGCEHFNDFVTIQNFLFVFTLISLFFFKSKNLKSGLIITVILTIVLGYILEPKTISHLISPPKTTMTLKDLYSQPLHLLQLIKHVLEISLFSLFDIAIGVFCLQQLQIIMRIPQKSSLALAYKSAGLNNLLSGFLLCGPNTTYIESTIGIQIGSRTPISILIVAGCFCLFLFCYPMVYFIPSALFRGILGFIGCSLLTPIYQMRYKTLTANLLSLSLIALMIYRKSIMDGLIAAIICTYIYNKYMRIKSPQIIQYSTLFACIILGLRLLS